MEPAGGPCHAIAWRYGSRPISRRPIGAPVRRRAAPGAAQLAWVDAACDGVANREADALVTGPVSKEQIVLFLTPGSQGLSRPHRAPSAAAARTRSGDGVLVIGFSVTSLVTTHLPLARVPGRALRPARRTRHILARLAPRAAVEAPPTNRGCSAQPARRRGRPSGGRGAYEHPSRHDAGAGKAREGCGGGDHRRAHSCRDGFPPRGRPPMDGVVAMYHDQATIPMKLVGFGEAVNVSLGLPIVRTSVDHGTAYDRAGKGAPTKPR